MIIIIYSFFGGQPTILTPTSAPQARPPQHHRAPRTPLRNMYTQPEQFKVIESYFLNHGHAHHQIQGWEVFIKNILQEIVSESQWINEHDLKFATGSIYITANGRKHTVSFLDVTVWPPNVKESNGEVRNVTPFECRTRGLTYANPVTYNVVARGGLGREWRAKEARQTLPGLADLPPSGDGGREVRRQQRAGEERMLVRRGRILHHQRPGAGVDVATQTPGEHPVRVPGGVPSSVTSRRSAVCTAPSTVRPRRSGSAS